VSTDDWLHPPCGQRRRTSISLADEKKKLAKGGGGGGVGGKKSSAGDEDMATKREMEDLCSLSVNCMGADGRANSWNIARATMLRGESVHKNQDADRRLCRFSNCPNFKKTLNGTGCRPNPGPLVGLSIEPIVDRLDWLRRRNIWAMRRRGRRGQKGMQKFTLSRKRGLFCYQSKSLSEN